MRTRGRNAKRRGSRLRLASNCTFRWTPLGRTRQTRGIRAGGALHWLWPRAARTRAARDPRPGRALHLAHLHQVDVLAQLGGNLLVYLPGGLQLADLLQLNHVGAGVHLVSSEKCSWR